MKKVIREGFSEEEISATEAGAQLTGREARRKQE